MRCSLVVVVFLVIAAPTLAQISCVSDRCYRPPDVTHAEPFSSLMETELGGRCLSECALQLLGSNHESLVTVSGVWKSFRESSLSGVIYDRVTQCGLGCVLAPMSNAVISECGNLCNASCSDIFQEGCIGWCTTGCFVYPYRLEGVLDTPPLPPLSFTASLPPLSFTASSDVNVAGLFDVTALANSSQSSPDDTITTFIFKVESEMGTFYFLQSSLTDALDLGFFSCREVNLSLAVVNRNGSSQFTSPTPVCVHGGFPSAPRNFRITSIVDDLRPDYLGHAVITLDWDMPEGVMALENYTLIIVTFGAELGGLCRLSSTNSTIIFPIIDTNATSYELMASNPGDLPLFGENRRGGTCSYAFVLLSMPGGKKSQQLIKFRDVPPTSPAPPTVDLSCYRDIDNETGLYSVQLEFTYSNVSLIQEAIDNYTITLRNVNVTLGGRIDLPRESLELKTVLEGSLVQDASSSTMYICGDGVAPISLELTTSGENISGVFRISSLCPQTEPPNMFYFQFAFASDDAGIWWRPLPKTTECPIIASPVQPTQVSVESIVILEELPLTVSESRVLDQFNLSWTPPSEPYGEIMGYEVFIGPSSTEDSELNEFIIISTNGSANVVIEGYNIPFNPPVCLYLQIRSIGQYINSNWSEPYFIPIFDGYNPGDCTPLSSEIREKEAVSPLQAGVIAESVIIFVLLLLLIPLSILCYIWPKYLKKRKLKHNWPKDDNGNSVGLHHGQIFINDVTSGPAGNGWEIPLEYITREQQLGEGSFGKVAKGFIRGPVPGTYTMKDSIHASVAIKFLKDSPSEREKRDFASEIALMKRIGFAKHAHVVGLFGCVTVPEPMCILLEYLEYGDLLAYLQDINEAVNQMKQQNSQWPVSVVTLPVTSTYTNLGDVEPDNLLSFAFQIASGMEFLVSLDVIHRDLACRNILVGDKKILKISDFGLSREGDAYVTTTRGKLPFKWMALESLQDREFTTQSDVWAYGVVLWEIATLGQFPYPTITNEEVLDYILEGSRLEQPPNCSNEVYHQMLQCWSVQPEERPSFSDLKLRFEAMLLETTNYLQFTSLTEGSWAVNSNGSHLAEVPVMTNGRALPREETENNTIHV